jgi:hypothetical protein
MSPGGDLGLPPAGKGDREVVHNEGGQKYLCQPQETP